MTFLDTYNNLKKELKLPKKYKHFVLQDKEGKEFNVLIHIGSKKAHWLFGGNQYFTTEGIGYIFPQLVVWGVNTEPIKAWFREVLAARMKVGHGYEVNCYGLDYGLGMPKLIFMKYKRPTSKRKACWTFAHPNGSGTFDIHEVERICLWDKQMQNKYK